MSAPPPQPPGRLPECHTLELRAASSPLSPGAIFDLRLDDAAAFRSVCRIDIYRGRPTVGAPPFPLVASLYVDPRDPLRFSGPVLSTFMIDTAWAVAHRPAGSPDADVPLFVDFVRPAPPAQDVAHRIELAAPNRLRGVRVYVKDDAILVRAACLACGRAIGVDITRNITRNAKPTADEPTCDELADLAGAHLAMHRCEGVTE